MEPVKQTTTLARNQQQGAAALPEKMQAAYLSQDGASRSALIEREVALCRKLAGRSMAFVLQQELTAAAQTARMEEWSSDAHTTMLLGIDEADVGRPYEFKEKS